MIDEKAKIEPVILVPKDYVQIVRCKDCERVRFDYYDKQYPCFCDKWLQGVEYDDYCSYGERKEE